MKNAMPVKSGNTFNKYESRNIAYRYLVNLFVTALMQYVPKEINKTVLDIGCGEGILLRKLDLNRKKVVALDISEDILQRVSNEVNNVTIVNANASALPFKDTMFDFVIACESLEHITKYKDALNEINRVTSRYVLFSVPLEPYWRICNCLRLQYLKHLGNTPGHVNHWTFRNFRNIISTYFEVIEHKRVGIWQILFAQKKV